MTLIMDPMDSHDRPHPHLERTKAIWARMNRYRKLREIVINGQTLDVAGVVAVSR